MENYIFFFMSFIVFVVDSKKNEYAVKIDLKHLFKFEIYDMSIYIDKCVNYIERFIYIIKICFAKQRKFI
jgi:hypothetical protein